MRVATRRSDMVVVLGAHVLQASGHRRRTRADLVGAHIDSLTRTAPGRIVRVEVTAGLPVPNGRLGEGGSKVVSLSPYGPGPQTDGRLLFHVMDIGEDLPLLRIWPLWARRSDVALVVTLGDASIAGSRLQLRHELLTVADAILTRSDATAALAVERLGIPSERVHPVFAGPLRRDAGSEPPILRARREVGGLRDGFILAVLGRNWRREAWTVLRGYSRLAPAVRAEHQLVIVDRDGILDAQDVARIAASSRAQPDPLVPHDLSAGGLAALIVAGRAVICPSPEEGFGLTVAEALAAGTSACIGDVPALREIVPDARARFDARSNRSLAKVLDTLLTDNPTAAELRRSAGGWLERFTWERVSERTLAAYDAALASRGRITRVRADPRPEPLAVVGPMPPEQSGIATHTFRLVAALARTQPVEVYCAHPEDCRPPEGGAKLRSIRELPWRRAAAQAIRPPLLCIANTPATLGAWLALCEMGGDVLLHDASLLDLYGGILEHGLLGDRTFLDVIKRIEGRRLPDTLVHAERVEFAALRKARVMLAGDVIDRARRVLVFSEFARTLVLEERPDRVGDVRVISHGVPRFPVAAPANDTPLVTSFGFVKQGDLFVEAAARVIADVPRVRFAFGGRIWNSREEAHLRERLAALRISDSFSIPAGAAEGWLSDEDYQMLLRSTTVAVQLRDPEDVRGEASGTTHDCLAVGLPTITNSVGAQNELPGDAVLRLGADPSADEVAAAIIGLLHDRSRRARLRIGALRYAATHGYDVVAAEVVEALS